MIADKDRPQVLRQNRIFIEGYFLRKECTMPVAQSSVLEFASYLMQFLCLHESLYLPGLLFLLLDRQHLRRIHSRDRHRHPFLH